MVFLSPPSNELDSYRYGVRCLGIMGLWAMAGYSVVPAQVGREITVPPHSSKGALTHCSGGRYVGSTVGQQAGTLPLQQPGCGGLPLVPDE